MPPPQRKVPKVDRSVADSENTVRLIKNEKTALGLLEDQLHILMDSPIAPFDRWTISASRIAMHDKFGLFYQEIQRKLPDGGSKTELLERAKRIETSLSDRMMMLQAMSVQIEFSLKA